MAYLVDTNVMVRWLLPHDPLSPPAVTAIDTLRGGGEAIYVGAQNLIELWNVATRPPTANGLGMTSTRAAEELNRIEALFPLLDDVPAIYRHWRMLVEREGVIGRQVYDARLAAVMLVHAVTHILTFNTDDFRRFPEIVAVDPRELDGDRGART
jgi:predicted nucleic acid-binding protein